MPAAVRRRPLLLAALLAGCDRERPPTPPQTVGSMGASVQLDGIPFVRQQPDFCGEAVAAAYLQKLGLPYHQDDVFAASGMDPARGMGATTRELRTALDRIGFETGPVWGEVSVTQLDAEMNAHFEALLADLHRGWPSIVCMRYSARPKTTEHFRLITGYDATADEVVYHEPAEDDGADRRMPRSTFLSLWPLKYDPDRWTVIRLRLEPGQLAPPPSRPEHTPADFAQHVMKLRARLPHGLSVVVESPFVVVGDERPELVQERSRRTVRWAVDRLKSAYFSHDPKRIIDVFLFAGADSYNRHAKLLFGELPDTPYGYYSPRDNAMVMNIATGGGTLVHEIVHPFVEANFPGCPSWFNEGLGSLYEQSAERGGEIVGLVNWRLRGLQRAIRKGRVPSFATLTGTTRYAFYEQDPGTNYAQSRYLLFHLQQEGKLRDYYRRFLAARSTDPTGYQTLQQVLGTKDMQAFQQRWEAWVMTLRYRS